MTVICQTEILTLLVFIWHFKTPIVAHRIALLSPLVHSANYCCNFSNAFPYSLEPFPIDRGAYGTRAYLASHCVNGNLRRQACTITSNKEVNYVFISPGFKVNDQMIFQCCYLVCRLQKSDQTVVHGNCFFFFFFSLNWSLLFCRLEYTINVVMVKSDALAQVVPITIWKEGICIP